MTEMTGYCFVYITILHVYALFSRPVCLDDFLNLHFVIIQSESVSVEFMEAAVISSASKSTRKFLRVRQSIDHQGSAF
jgi:hypothetical protein